MQSFSRTKQTSNELNGTNRIVANCRTVDYSENFEPKNCLEPRLTMYNSISTLDHVSKKNGRLDLSFTKCNFPADYLPYVNTPTGNGHIDRRSLITLDDDYRASYSDSAFEDNAAFNDSSDEANSHSNVHSRVKYPFSTSDRKFTSSVIDSRVNSKNVSFGSSTAPFSSRLLSHHLVTSPLVSAYNSLERSGKQLLSPMFSSLLADSYEGRRPLSNTTASTGAAVTTRGHSSNTPTTIDTTITPSPLSSSSSSSLHSSMLATGDARTYRDMASGLDMDRGRYGVYSGQHHPHHHQYYRRHPPQPSTAHKCHQGQCSKWLQSCGWFMCLLFAVFLLILLSAVIGFSLYLTVVTTFLSNPMTVYSISGNFKVTSGDQFTLRLLNKTSEDYRRRASRYETILAKLLTTSQALNDTLLSTVQVYSFRQGSLVVFFRFYADKHRLEEVLNLKRTKTVLNIGGSVENVVLDSTVILAQLRHLLVESFSSAPYQQYLRQHQSDIEIDVNSLKLSVIDLLSAQQYQHQQNATSATSSIVSAGDSVRTNHRHHHHQHNHHHHHVSDNTKVKSDTKFELANLTNDQPVNTVNGSESNWNDIWHNVSDDNTSITTTTTAASPITVTSNDPNAMNKPSTVNDHSVIKIPTKTTTSPPTTVSILVPNSYDNFSESNLYSNRKTNQIYLNEILLRNHTEEALNSNVGINSSHDGAKIKFTNKTDDDGHKTALNRELTLSNFGLNDLNVANNQTIVTNDFDESVRRLNVESREDDDDEEVMDEQIIPKPNTAQQMEHSNYSNVDNEFQLKPPHLSIEFDVKVTTVPYDTEVGNYSPTTTISSIPNLESVINKTQMNNLPGNFSIIPNHFHNSTQPSVPMFIGSNEFLEDNFDSNIRTDSPTSKTQLNFDSNISTVLPLNMSSSEFSEDFQIESATTSSSIDESMVQTILNPTEEFSNNSEPIAESTTVFPVSNDSFSSASSVDGFLISELSNADQTEFNSSEFKLATNSLNTKDSLDLKTPVDEQVNQTDPIKHDEPKDDLSGLSDQHSSQEIKKFYEATTLTSVQHEYSNEFVESGLSEIPFSNTTWPSIGGDSFVLPTFGKRISKKLISFNHQESKYGSPSGQHQSDNRVGVNQLIKNPNSFKVKLNVPIKHYTVDAQEFAGNSINKWNSDVKEIPSSTPLTEEEDETGCDVDQFRCGLSGDCVSMHQRCNRVVDCVDGTDEQGCRCVDYLRHDQLHRNKICDGVVDCHDTSDETAECTGCRDGMFVCLGQGGQCITADKVCNGENDCPNGDDEQSCITLFEPQPETNDSAVGMHYSAEGTLYIRHHGLWAPLCFDNYDTDQLDGNSSAPMSTMLQIDDMGQAVCKANYFTQLKSIRIVSNDQLDSFYSISANISNNLKPTLSLWSTLFESTECPGKKVAKIECENMECGLRPASSKLRRRIIGGQGSSFGSWPWQVALYREGEFQCGAVVINQQWLLTAAHCFHSAPKAYWTARSGVLRRGSLYRGLHEQVHQIVRVIIHPQYVDKGFLNDIALLQLDRPLRFSQYVRPICLPTSQDTVSNWHGQLCTTVGWGKLYEHGRIFPDTLQEVKLPIISTDECRKRTLFLPLYKITKNMFCAGFEHGGRDACLGDSGGPMMCQKENGKWILLGITSNGDGCGRAGRPGVYTKVYNYLDWIDGVIASVEPGTKEDPRTVPNKAIGNNNGRKLDSCAGHRCPLGKCLLSKQVCDNIVDCEDSSDEINCDFGQLQSSIPEGYS